MIGSGRQAMKKQTLLNLFVDEFKRGRFVLTILALMTLTFTVLIIWMVCDVLSGGKEIPPEKYTIVHSYAEDIPELKSSVEKCLDDGIINRREFDKLKREYVELMKKNLGESKNE